MSATMRRWSLVDRKGKTRGTCEATTPEQAVFAVRGPGKQLPDGWQIVDRGPAGPARKGFKVGDRVRFKSGCWKGYPDGVIIEEDNSAFPFLIRLDKAHGGHEEVWDCPECLEHAPEPKRAVTLNFADFEAVKDQLAQAAAMNEAVTAERDALRKEVQDGIARIAEQGETIGTITAERNEAMAELEEARAARRRVLELLYTSFPPAQQTWTGMARAAEVTLENIRRHRKALGLSPEPKDGGTIADAIVRLKEERDAAIKERDAAFVERDAADHELDTTQAQRDSAWAALELADAKLADLRALHRTIDLTGAEGDGWRMIHDAMGELLA